MDFTPLVHLKKLAISYFVNILDRNRGGNRWRIPVSRTLARLANLQELHITVHRSAVTAPLPPWLAQLPAFVGLGIESEHEAPSGVFMDSLRAMTGLKTLSVMGELDDRDGQFMDTIARMSRLTSLVIQSDKKGVAATGTRRGRL
eukprot:jgi/Mesen1/7279/ME000373S06343